MATPTRDETDTPPSLTPLYFIFDVESIGLHGEGFAVGYVVIDRQGTQYGSGRYACPPAQASGTADGRAWVTANVPPLDTKLRTPIAVRRRFWADWLFWKKQGAVMVTDYGWPVEARFLAACVDDAPGERQWSGPYPCHELATFMVAAGLDPDEASDRLASEPAHDPLGDAKLSARRLVLALERIPRWFQMSSYRDVLEMDIVDPKVPKTE